MSLKDRIEAKRLATTMQIDTTPQGVSVPEKLSLSEKIKRAQSNATALKLKVNTNITGNSENPPKPQEMGLLGISENKNVSIPINSENTLHTTNASQPKLSISQRLALAKQATKIVEDAITTESAQPKATIQPLTILPVVKDVPLPVNDVENSVKTNVVLSLKERIAQKKLTALPAEQATIVDIPVEPSVRMAETFSLDIVLNEKQQAAVNFAEIGKSFVLLGAAGTGKTSSEREILHALLAHNHTTNTTFKSGSNRITAPSVAVCAYTRRAAANSAKAILKDPLLREQLPHNIMTIHNLLEFQPETYYDEVDRKEKFRFSPMRHENNKLAITHLIIEEATLVGLDLWAQLYAALPYDVQIIFVGDINQLPPVFGPSILNYALTKLPVIELNQVYRQAEGSPIINNAHRILRGEYLEEGTNSQGKLQIITGKRDIKVGQHKTLLAISTMFKGFYDSGLYDPDEDMLLSPWNKHELGTDSLNTHISEFLSIKHGKIVYEVLAGFHKLYLAEGDKVIYNKRDALIVSIEKNPAYVGKEPQMPGADLSRLGVRRGRETDVDEDDFDLDSTADGIDYSNFSIEDLEDTATERKMQSSHKVMLAFEDGHTETITAAGELAPAVFSLGYAMTVHKSQGSEWRRVFIIFHPDHAISLSREMLYTAITRAREEVYLIAKKYVVDKAVTTQRVKGNTLQDKIALFNSGVKDFNLQEVRVTKPSLGNK